MRVIRVIVTIKDRHLPHKQIVEWCESFFYKYSDADATNEYSRLLPVLNDIDAQWDLYLVNTLSPEELTNTNFESVVLPLEWFEEWISKVE